ncbi:hypothetical protein [Mesorhizobium sp.]|nr:hypothetical protein [Mesorhizobium sp.]
MERLSKTAMLDERRPKPPPVLQYGGWYVGDATRESVKSTALPQNLTGS